MGYSDLLQKDEWFDKAARIIERDSYRCQRCGKLGYHASSFLKFRDVSELDKLLKGWSINGNPFSFFLKKEISDTSAYEISTNFSIEPYYSGENGERFIVNDYLLYRLRSDIHHTINQKLDAYLYAKTNTDKLLINKNIRQRLFFSKTKSDSFSKGILISTHNDSFTFIRGIAYHIDTNLSDIGILSLEHMFPTDAVYDGYGCVMMGSIIMNISYQNYIISLYFEEFVEGLNVHHKYYIKGKMPWEYEDNALIALCESCHRETHKTDDVPIYRTMNSSLVRLSDTTPCDRCNGAGYIHQYKHIQNGICFDCWGEGIKIKELDNETCYSI